MIKRTTTTKDDTMDLTTTTFIGAVSVLTIVSVLMVLASITYDFVAKLLSK